MAVGLNLGGITNNVYSYDGMTWYNGTSSPASAGFSLTGTGGGNAVAYAPELNTWVIGGFGNCDWMYSYNGINFFGSGVGGSCGATQGNCDGVFNAVQGLAWSSTQRQFVGVGGYNTAAIVTSSDGIYCTTSTSALGTNTLYGVAYSKHMNLWISVGAASGAFSIQRSVNGIVWIGCAGTAAIMPTAYGIAWSTSQSLWVAVGSTGGTSTIATSSNGVTFTAVSAANGGNVFSVQGMSVFFGNGVWYLVGIGNAGANTLATSTNGVTFTGLGKTTFSLAGYGVVFGSDYNMWVAVGATNNGIAYSVDGSGTWTGVGTTPLANRFVAGTNSAGSHPTYAGVGVRSCVSTTPTRDGADPPPLRNAYYNRFNRTLGLDEMLNVD